MWSKHVRVEGLLYLQYMILFNVYIHLLVTFCKVDKNDQDNMAWVVFIIICRYYTKLRKVISINKSKNDSKQKIPFKC
jgi:hypothetical protein